jgi:DHA1 family tetracycline resistance protein-like MFS transporter
MSILNRNAFFRRLSSLAFFTGMVSSGDQVLLIYYLEETLRFTSADVGKMFLILGIVGLFAQSVLIKPLTDHLGERNVVAFAFLCGAVDNLLYGTARNKRTVFVALGVAGLTGMAFPTISAMKANNVDRHEQGRVQGALYSLQALASGVGPIALKGVYNLTKDTRYGPGSMFVFASSLYLVAVVIAFSLPQDKANASRRPQEDTTATEEEEDDEEEDLHDDDGNDTNTTAPMFHIPDGYDDTVTQEYVPLASDSSSSSSSTTTSRNDDHNYGTISP